MATPNGQDSLIEDVVIHGNLANLSAQQKSSYYAKVCSSLGLNPYSRPFEFLSLQGKTILYARKDATDQLRSLRRVSLTIVSREIVNDVYVVTARATLPDGRTDEEIGAVPIGGLKGELYANALMKASTKAKRRVTLSVCGLGWLDESEVDSIPDARVETPPTPIARVQHPPPIEPDAIPFEQEQPPLLGTDGEITSDLWDDVKELAGKLDAVGVKYMLPPPTQTRDFHHQWVVRMTRALRAARP